MSVVTLLTDYGTRDYYVAAMKGVICSMAPDAQIIDVTHEIEPFDVAQGAFVLRQVWPWFPRGTVHVAVVDPGVGSDRQLLLAQYAGRFALAPDNGLLTFVHRDFAVEAMHVLEDRRLFLPQVSSTFHGRDILAAAAAHLANGVKPRSFGRVTDRLEMLAVPHRAEVNGNGWMGRVIYVDRFGTLVTNLREDQIEAERLKQLTVAVNGETVGPIRGAFHEVAPGSLVALVGSSGYVEIAVNQGRAADRLGPIENVRVEVR